MQTMKRLLIYYLLILCLSANAQPECHIYHFDELTEKTLRVTRILQDRQGFLWVGTLNGLYRFDGYNFVSFKAKAGDGSHSNTDHVSSIYLSRNNDIWCLIGNRACLFDTRSTRFIDVLQKIEQKNRRSYDVKKIRTMHDGTTWLITSDGLYICIRNGHSPESASVKLHGLIDEDRMITDDCHGRTWILTNKGTFMFNGKQLRLKQTFRMFANSGHHSWLLDDGGKLHVLGPDDRIVPLVNGMLNEPILEIHPLLDNRMAIVTATRLLMMNTLTGMITDSGIRGRVNWINQYAPHSLWLQMSDGRIIRLADDRSRNAAIAGITSKITVMTEDPNRTVWMLTDDGTLYYLADGTTMPVRYPTPDVNMKNGTNSLIDRQGNIWFRNETGIYKLSFKHQYLHPLRQEYASQIRSAMVDSKGRYWVSGKDDNTLRVFDRHNRPIGYLGPDGHLHAAYTPFGTYFYCMLQDRSGQIWLGNKPNGLFRLRETDSGAFLIRQFRPGQGKTDLSSGEIYDMVQDRRGRLWIATHGGGLNCLADTRAEQPTFCNSRNTPALALTVDNLNVLTITHDDRLLCGSDNGLLIADLRIPSLRQLKFHYHTREGNRSASLSSSCVTGIVEDHRHRIFICTESGGVNSIASDNLLTNELEFRHYNMYTGFLSDVSQAIFEYRGHIWVLAPNQLIEMDPDSIGSTGCNSYFKRDKLIFSPCKPLILPDGRWLLGTENGAYTVRLEQLRKQCNVPRLAITGLKIQGQDEIYHIDYSDTITLQPQERSFMLSFAALDYTETSLIDYAYHMGDDKKPWTYIGHSHSISFGNINPGKYILKIRSTSGDGIWVENTRTLMLIIKPTFWETPWATVLYILLLSSIIYGIINTNMYIKRIKEQQREALNKYLKLMDSSRQDGESHPQQTEIIQQAHQKAADDDFMKRLMAFIEQNMSNSDLTVEDMATALAISQSGLSRKLKDLLGSTPSDLLKKARIEHACTLLKKNLGMNIAEIAFFCGFADPKYFSKCFKASKGLTPSDYRLEQ